MQTLAKSCISQEELEWQQSNATVHSLNVTTRSNAVLELAMNEKILNLIRPIIGNDIEIQHSKLAAQPGRKNAGGFDWHQDFCFFPHTNTNLVAVFIALDDHQKQNGGMHYLKGSHLLGPLNHKDHEGYFVSVCQEKKHWENHPDKIHQINMKAGSVAIHHCLTLHGSGPNLTGAPRRGVVFQFRAANAYQLAGNIWQDTGLLVSGEKRNEVYCQNLSFELPLWREVIAPNVTGYGSSYFQTGSFDKEKNIDLALAL